VSVQLMISGTDFAEVASVLTGGGRDVPRQLQKDLRQAARPMVRAMQAAIVDVGMTTEVRTGTAVGLRGSGGGGLRAAIAGAVRVRPTSVGAIIDVDTGSLGDRQNLPALIDGQGRWRHPVLGNRRAWVTQWANPTGWFTKTALRHGASVLHYQQGRSDMYLNRLAARLR
jgi:hypothetical protein